MSQLTNYIEKELKKGFSKDQIKKKLLDVGYKSNLIEDSFKFIDGKKDTIIRKPEPSKTKSSSKKWIFVGIGVLAIIIFAFLSLYVSNITKNVDGVPIEETDTNIERIEYVPHTLGSEVSHCKDLSEIEKNKCVIEYSTENDDNNACNYLSKEWLNYGCLEENIGINNCEYDSLFGQKTECFTDLAIETNNISYCSISGNITYCKTQVALTLNNPLICEDNIKCIITMTIETDNPNLCEQENIHNYKAWCYREYSIATNTNLCVESDIECRLYFGEVIETEEENTSQV